MNFGKVRAIQLEEMQEYTQGKIPLDKLPFDLTAGLGEVVDAEQKSPGVYYLALRNGECAGIPGLLYVSVLPCHFIGGCPRIDR